MCLGFVRTKSGGPARNRYVGRCTWSGHRKKRCGLPYMIPVDDMSHGVSQADFSIAQSVWAILDSAFIPVQHCLMPDIQ